MVECHERDLAANPRTCTLAYFHHPLFSSGASSGANSKMKPSWEVLYAARADVVLNGHVHNYELFAPPTPSRTAAAAKGIREFVIGTGGYSLNRFKTTVANSQVRNANSFGVLKLTLHPTGYDWEFVAVDGTVDGRTADSGAGSCSPATPSDTQPPRVVHTFTSANKTEVAPAIDVTATFSEKMMDASINGNTIKLLLIEGTTTTKVPASVSYDADIDPLTATLDPSEPLRRGVTYKAGITTGAKDLAGNSLDQSSTAGSQQKAWAVTTSNEPP